MRAPLALFACLCALACDAQNFPRYTTIANYGSQIDPNNVWGYPFMC